MCFNFGQQKASTPLTPAAPAIAQSATYDGGAQVVGAAGSGGAVNGAARTASGTNIPGRGGFKKRRRVSAGLGL